MRQRQHRQQTSCSPPLPLPVHHQAASSSSSAQPSLQPSLPCWPPAYADSRRICIPRIAGGHLVRKPQQQGGPTWCTGAYLLGPLAEGHSRDIRTAATGRLSDDNVQHWDPHSRTRTCLWWHLKPSSTRPGALGGLTGWLRSTCSAWFEPSLQPAEGGRRLGQERAASSASSRVPAKSRTTTTSEDGRRRRRTTATTTTTVDDDLDRGRRDGRRLRSLSFSMRLAAIATSTTTTTSATTTDDDGGRRRRRTTKATTTGPTRHGYDSTTTSTTVHDDFPPARRQHSEAVAGPSRRGAWISGTSAGTARGRCALATDTCALAGTATGKCHSQL